MSPLQKIAGRRSPSCSHRLGGEGCIPEGGAVVAVEFQTFRSHNQIIFQFLEAAYFLRPTRIVEMMYQCVQNGVYRTDADKIGGAVFVFDLLK